MVGAWLVLRMLPLIAVIAVIALPRCVLTVRRWECWCRLLGGDAMRRVLTLVFAITIPVIDSTSHGCVCIVLPIDRTLHAIAAIVEFLTTLAPTTATATAATAAAVLAFSARSTLRQTGYRRGIKDLRFGVSLQRRLGRSEGLAQVGNRIWCDHFWF
jgi:hypothetical protein